MAKKRTFTFSIRRERVELTARFPETVEEAVDMIGGEQILDWIHERIQLEAYRAEAEARRRGAGEE